MSNDTSSFLTPPASLLELHLPHFHRILTAAQRPQTHAEAHFFRLELMLVQHAGAATAVAQPTLPASRLAAQLPLGEGAWPT